MTFKDIPFGDKLNGHLAAVEAAMTGRKFCPTCQVMRPIEGGVKRTNVWRCKFCVERAKKMQEKRREETKAAAQT